MIRKQLIALRILGIFLCTYAMPLSALRKPNNSHTNYFKPIINEAGVWTKEILINPVAFGFISHMAWGKDFYKPCCIHFLLKPRLQQLLENEPRKKGEMEISEEVLRYGLGAAASNTAGFKLLGLCIAARSLYKLINASSDYLADYLAGDEGC